MHASQNAEYQKFVPAFVSLLREAMQLRGRGLEDGDYYDEAKRIKNEMLKMINAQAKDPGLQKYQDIFRRHPERIFQWAENRSVPAEKTCPNAASDGRSSHGRFAADHRVRTR